MPRSLISATTCGRRTTATAARMRTPRSKNYVYAARALDRGMTAEGIDGDFTIADTAMLNHGVLVALNRSTGAIVFRRQLPPSANAPIAIAGNTVIVPAGGPMTGKASGSGNPQVVAWPTPYPSNEALLPPLSSLTGPGPVSRSGRGEAGRVRRCPQAGHAGHLDRPINPLGGGAPARRDGVPAALHSARRSAGACGPEPVRRPDLGYPSRRSYFALASARRSRRTERTAHYRYPLIGGMHQQSPS